MPIEFLIGFRFLRSLRKDRAISLVTWISIAGVMLGVAALIVSISLMNGFRYNLFKSITATEPHAWATPQHGTLSGPENSDQSWLALENKARNISGITGASAYLSRQAFVTVNGEYRAVIARGVDPQAFLSLTGISGFLRQAAWAGKDTSLLEESARPAVFQAMTFPNPQGALPGVVIGAALARALMIDVGDSLRVISPETRLTPLGQVPYMKDVRVVGVFDTGLASSDEVILLMDRRLAQRLFRAGNEADGVALKLDDPLTPQQDILQNGLPGLQIRQWMDLNRDLFRVMQLEKAGLVLILTLIILVAFFNIVGSLFMLVGEKRRALAILMAMGATESQIRRVFFSQGVWIGTLGTLTGAGLGLGVSWFLSVTRLVELPAHLMVGDARLPIRVEYGDVLWIVALSFAICVVVTLYPAQRAAAIQPARLLQEG
ncbi:MAG: ABC transporter permease [Deltaproteobacteria bacterium]|nr:ABC transporter permease [Deltaproteobacteria bacterium]